MPHRPLKRILLVDDDADLRAVVTLALTALGDYAVESCASAPEALALAPAFAPDMIVLDLMMPGMDGFRALEALRQAEATARTPVVVMSGSVRGRDRSQHRALGCLGVIPKPFDPETLPEQLEALWEAHALERMRAHEREFEDLRRAYLCELAEKASAMEAAAAVLLSRGWNRPALESLYDLAHRLAGASGLYRLATLSRAARALEDIVKRLLAPSPWPPASAPEDLARMVHAVSRMARQQSQREEGSRSQARAPAVVPVSELGKQPGRRGRSQPAEGRGQ
jgi:CheY-like chemotaxis protein